MDWAEPATVEKPLHTSKLILNWQGFDRQVDIMGQPPYVYNHVLIPRMTVQAQNFRTTVWAWRLKKSGFIITEEGKHIEHTAYYEPEQDPWEFMNKEGSIEPSH